MQREKRLRGALLSLQRLLGGSELIQQLIKRRKDRPHLTDVTETITEL